MEDREICALCMEPWFQATSFDRFMIEGQSRSAERHERGQDEIVGAFEGWRFTAEVTCTAVGLRRFRPASDVGTRAAERNTDADGRSDH